MPTNDHQSAEAGPARGPVADLAAHRRDRLQDLLRRRSRLAAVVAERVAHDLSNTDDFIIELLDVEQAIEDRRPAVYEELAFTEWLFADMALMHTPDEPLGPLLHLHRRHHLGATAEPSRRPRRHARARSGRLMPAARVTGPVISTRITRLYQAGFPLTGHAVTDACVECGCRVGHQEVVLPAGTTALDLLDRAGWVECPRVTSRAAAGRST
jgi:hypothetical protein